MLRFQAVLALAAAGAADWAGALHESGAPGH